MTEDAPAEPTPGFITAGMLLRAVSSLLLLVATLFNRHVLAFFDLVSTPDIITARGIWATQKTFFFSGLFLLLFAEAINPSTAHRVLKKAFNKPLTLNLLLFLFSLFIPMLILELTLRPFTTDHLEKKATTIFMKDPDLDWKLRPNSRGWWADVEVQINGKGLRGPEIPYERSHQTLRILYLGDSVTFGYGLPQYKMSFPYVVEELLEQNKRVEVETINAGVGGYSPWQYDIYLRKEGVKYQPDVVLVGFVLNDVTEKFNLVRFGGTGPGSQLSRSYYSMGDWLAHHSAIYATIHRITTRMRLGENPQRAAVAQERVLVEDLARHPDSARVKKSWKLTLENLARLAEYCQDNELRLVVVIFPFTFQFEDPSSLNAPQRVLKSFCDDRQLPCLDLLPPLSRHLHEHHVKPSDLFLDRDHLSVQGSRVAAALITKFLDQEVPLHEFSTD